jgi:hypothetical protein
MGAGPQMVVNEFVPQKKTGKPRMKVTYRERTSEPTRSRAEYVHVSQETQKVIDKMVEVTASDKERADLRAIAFQLRKYNEAVNANNYEEADRLREQMQPSLVRGQNVAANANKRKADWARAAEERRHRERMAEERRQTEILDRIRRSTVVPQQGYIISRPRR